MSFAQPRDSAEPAPLPKRRTPSASGDGVWSTVDADRQGSRGDPLSVFENALNTVSGKDPNVYGMLLASADGLVLASDIRGIVVDTVAAMAAAAASIAGQFTSQADIGDSKASLFEGDSGYVGVFPVETSVLLVVFGRKDMTMGLFNVAARTALSRVQKAIERQRTPSPRNG
ncbi:roadblock/LC7 domain-containing protein [Actinophytocola sp.]|uniref:roadblock/LC7 domain-containing protein n=1 Tax=Actinophytocola sp. TaxID=1872138 RepID=UPI00389B120A